MNEITRTFDDDDRGDIKLGTEHRLGIFTAMYVRSHGYIEVRNARDRERRLRRKACWWCGAPLTRKLRLARVLWAPWWRPHSFIWRHCCSRVCYQRTMAMENALADATADAASWREEPAPRLLRRARKAVWE